MQEYIATELAQANGRYRPEEALLSKEVGYSFVNDTLPLGDGYVTSVWKVLIIFRALVSNAECTLGM